MDLFHYNYTVFEARHYFSRNYASAIIISHFFETCHYVPFHFVYEKFWTKIPSSSTSQLSQFFSMLACRSGRRSARASTRPWPPRRQPRRVRDLGARGLRAAGVGGQRPRGPVGRPPPLPPRRPPQLIRAEEKGVLFGF